MSFFSWDYDFFADGTKARRLGFHEFIDTEQMFYGLFDELKAQKNNSVIDCY